MRRKAERQRAGKQGRGQRNLRPGNFAEGLQLAEIAGIGHAVGGLVNE